MIPHLPQMKVTLVTFRIQVFHTTHRGTAVRRPSPCPFQIPSSRLSPEPDPNPDHPAHAMVKWMGNGKARILWDPANIRGIGDLVGINKTNYVNRFMRFHDGFLVIHPRIGWSLWSNVCPTIVRVFERVFASLAGCLYFAFWKDWFLSWHDQMQAKETVQHRTTKQNHATGS